ATPLTRGAVRVPHPTTRGRNSFLSACGLAHYGDDTVVPKDRYEESNSRAAAGLARHILPRSGDRTCREMELSHRRGRTRLSAHYPGWKNHRPGGLQRQDRGDELHDVVVSVL